ncbi:MAG: DUF1559 domain-containing protein [Rubripirellula sp.]
MIRHAVMLIALALGLQNAHSQDNSVQKNPTPTSENSLSIESFIGQDVCLAVEVDITSLDLTANQALLEKLSGEKFPPELAVSIRDFVDALIQAGVEKGYLIATVGSIGDMLWRLQLNGGLNGISPLLVLPCKKPDQVQAALEAFTQKQGQTTSSLKIQKLSAANEDGRSFVLIGNSEPAKRATQTAQPQRDALNEAQIAKNHLTHKVIFSLPAETRRDLMDLWPDKLPPTFPVAISPRAMVQDIRWIVASADLPPEPALQIQIKMFSKEAVQRVENAISTSLALAGPIKQHVQMTTADNILTLDVAIEPLLALLAAAPSPARAQQKMNSLKQIGLATHNYHALHGHLPPRCYTDPAGKPLQSWRVAILPLIEQQAVYDAFNLKEPWNAASNQKVAATQIPLYSNGKSETTKTTFRAPVMKGSLWEGDGPPRQFGQMTDGLSNTIAVIDAPLPAATAWANPEPWLISAEDPMSDIFGDRETVAALILDGSVITLKKSEMTNEKLKAMLTFAGGEQVEF